MLLLEPVPVCMAAAWTACWLSNCSVRVAPFIFVIVDLTFIPPLGRLDELFFLLSNVCEVHMAWYCILRLAPLNFLQFSILSRFLHAIILKCRVILKMITASFNHASWWEWSALRSTQAVVWRWYGNLMERSVLESAFAAVLKQRPG